MSSKKSLNPYYYSPRMIWVLLASVSPFPLLLFVLIIFCKENPDFDLLLLIPSLIVGMNLLLVPTKLNLVKPFLKDLVKQIPALFLVCSPAIVLGFVSPVVTSSLSLAEGGVLLVTTISVLFIYLFTLYRACRVLTGEIKPRPLW